MLQTSPWQTTPLSPFLKPIIGRGCVHRHDAGTPIGVDGPGARSYAHTMISRIAMAEPLGGRRRIGTRGACLACTLWLTVVCGCMRPKTCEFEVVDYRASGAVSRYRETFSEGYYGIDKSGNLDLILLRQKYDPDDPVTNITQVIHIHTFWQSIPGVTVAERTQINGHVSYFIVSGELGQSFEGAGSVFFTRARDGETITGTLDLARLKPARQLVASADLFERVDLSGCFVAEHDPKRVQHTIHDMNRRFGPRPPHQP